MQQHGQPDTEGGPIQRALKTQTESMNTGIVPVDVQMMDVGRGSTCLLFLNGKPAANFFGFAFKVMEIAD